MRAFTSFKIHCKEFLFNISNTKPQVLKVKLGIDSHAKSLAVTRVWLHMSGRHWQETSESPAMAPYVTSSWNRITVTRPDTFWQHVGKLLCTLQNVSPVIQQCRFYWRDKTHLCSLKDKGVKFVRGLKQPGNPRCTNRLSPWPSLGRCHQPLALLSSGSSGSFLVILHFLSSQLDAVVCHSLSLNPTCWQGPWYLLTDLHVLGGFPDLPGQWVKPTQIHPRAGYHIPSTSVTWNQPLPRTMSWVSCSLRLCSGLQLLLYALERV